MYENLVFQDNEHERVFKDVYVDKLDTFINFYNTYQPTGTTSATTWRNYHGVNIYVDGKNDYDNLVAGSIVIDDYIWNPNSNILLSLRFMKEDLYRQQHP